MQLRYKLVIIDQLNDRNDSEITPVITVHLYTVYAVSATYLSLGLQYPSAYLITFSSKTLRVLTSYKLILNYVVNIIGQFGNVQTLLVKSETKY